MQNAKHFIKKSHRILDRYPLEVEFKGGSRTLAATRFVFTSNRLPHQIYRRTEWSALRRRINNYVLFWDSGLEGNPISTANYDEFLEKVRLYVSEDQYESGSHGGVPTNRPVARLTNKNLGDGEGEIH